MERARNGSSMWVGTGVMCWKFQSEHPWLWSPAGVLSCVTELNTSLFVSYLKDGNKERSLSPGLW